MSSPYQNSPQQYYGQPYAPQHAAWQPPPPPPKRDWRDWFIMATVVGGVSYGVYELTKRYVYPLIAPPTPERLEQDKKTIEEQFDGAFALVEQLAKDTEALKAAEQERTERLDTALSDFEGVINELKSANKRRDDEAQRIRDDVYNLKDAIPKALETQKDLTDQRLREINAELTSLKTLISQRMTAPSPSPTPVNGYLRPNSTSGTPATPSGNKSASVADEKPSPEPTTPSTAEPAKPNNFSSAGKSLSLGGSGAKASIPAWQMAMANKSTNSSSAASSGDAAGASQAQAGGSA
ncbi:peroxisomal membrane protein PER10 [Verticillium alfalfae VaMs.102]|uniref:Peroxisomal membrane protein PEX14 n=1 Tax=Verticillium alfalfae (strain VaMs.102 / ATCC MYA-4576 / FGSC 10136) TaxID=526221 RepID=C9STH0_VERA1|nr:peroxisomal membrane protein PER10 [Verticillium alfalfae VaMs.102]EEY22085.1 peroxisomal membrane protein PER10 [Verticillium alfalfae VaMs.102]